MRESASDAALRALVEQHAIEYHKSPDGEGEYGCNGATCPGVQKLVKFAEGAIALAVRAPVSPPDKEREKVMRIIAQCLSPDNQNVVNGDLVGSVCDMAQVYVSAKDTANEAMRQWEADKALMVIIQHERNAHYADAQSLAPRAEWQPIETAPRPTRGRRKIIDVWCVTDDREAAKFYFGSTMCGVKDKMQWQGRVAEVYWLDGAWRPATGLRMHGLTVTPTHWMPLPVSPAPTPTPDGTVNGKD